MKAILALSLALTLASCMTIPDVFALHEGITIEELRSTSLRPLRVIHITKAGHTIETWTYPNASFTFIDGQLAEWSGK